MIPNRYKNILLFLFFLNIILIAIYIQNLPNSSLKYIATTSASDTTTSSTSAAIAPTSTPASTSTNSTSITASPTPVSTILIFDVLLHGIGAAGDNANPGGANSSNKNPLHPQKALEISITNINNQVVANFTSPLIYNSSQGNFLSVSDLGSSFPTGNYTIKLKGDRYLRKIIPGITAIVNLKSNKIIQVSLIAGDIYTDNALNVLDYNILLDCGYGSINPLPMADPNSRYNSKYCLSHKKYRPLSDLDDNGIIDSLDYNLFLREISVQNGE